MQLDIQDKVTMEKELPSVTYNRNGIYFKHSKISHKKA